MASDMAAMLDELMGRDRNLLPSEAKEYHFYDDDVCKYYLVGLCPHDLFVNTKNHLGTVHNCRDFLLSLAFFLSRFCCMLPSLS